ncbi:MAG: hypothetical protein QG555_1707 [Thermodesulfobacteriota bacterium]|nr:hypothetical protein [Thermodesulfobacteriota bacterium]
MEFESKYLQRVANKQFFITAGGLQNESEIPQQPADIH